MRRISASVPALLFATGLLLTDGMSELLTVDRSMIQLAQTGTQTPPPPPPPAARAKPKKLPPIKETPPSKRNPGACDATRGNKGTCNCVSTQNGGQRCIGNCCPDLGMLR